MSDFFSEEIKNRQLNLPEGVAPLPGSRVATPAYFVGDDAFPVSKTMIKPISGRRLGENGRIYNYRISRARRVIENDFRILVARLRVFENMINLHQSRLVSSYSLFTQFFTSSRVCDESTRTVL